MNINKSIAIISSIYSSYCRIVVVICHFSIWPTTWWIQTLFPSAHSRGL